MVELVNSMEEPPRSGHTSFEDMENRPTNVPPSRYNKPNKGMSALTVRFMKYI